MKKRATRTRASRPAESAEAAAVELALHCDARTIAEADGALKYANPERARWQLRRDALLREAGFEVVHFTWHELTAAPDQVIGSIRAAFGRAGALRASVRSAG